MMKYRFTLKTEVLNSPFTLHAVSTAVTWDPRWLNPLPGRHCPTTDMSQWFPRSIHCDTDFPQGFSLFSKVINGQALLSY